MNKEEIFQQIKNELTEKELLVLASMLQGDSIVDTAHNCGIPVNYAQSYRKTVYEVVGHFVDYGTDKKAKQKILIDFLQDFENVTANKEEQAEDKKQECQKIKTPNYLVFNPKKGSPNKVYKTHEKAVFDAIDIAKKSQNPVFVLQIDTLVVPHCKVETIDVAESGIPEKYLNDEIPF